MKAIMWTLLERAFIKIVFFVTKRSDKNKESSEWMKLEWQKDKNIYPRDNMKSERSRKTLLDHIKNIGFTKYENKKNICNENYVLC